MQGELVFGTTRRPLIAIDHCIRNLRASLLWNSCNLRSIERNNLLERERERRERPHDSCASPRCNCTLGGFSLTSGESLIMAEEMRNDASSSGGDGSNRGESVIDDYGRRRSSCGYCKSGGPTSISHGQCLNCVRISHLYPRVQIRSLIGVSQFSALNLLLLGSFNDLFDLLG